MATDMKLRRLTPWPLGVCPGTRTVLTRLIISGPLVCVGSAHSPWRILPQALEIASTPTSVTLDQLCPLEHLEDWDNVSVSSACPRELSGTPAAHSRGSVLCERMNRDRLQTAAS